MRHFASQLFPPQNGPRFRKLDLELILEEDIFEIAALGKGVVLPSNLSRSMLDTAVRPLGLFVHTNGLFCRPGIIRFDRPLKSDWTQRFGVFVEVESLMGDHDAPNDYAQP